MLGTILNTVVQEELVAKLQSEISVEQDTGEDPDLSANIKEYIDNSPFQVFTSLIFLDWDGS